MRLTVERARATPAPSRTRATHPIGVIAIDSLFSPVQRVNYSVTETRAGARADSTLSPSRSSPTGVSSRGRPCRTPRGSSADTRLTDGYRGHGAADPAPARWSACDHRRALVEDLELTVLAFNCLKREGIDTIGQLATMSEEELMNIRNLGMKSVDEIRARSSSSTATTLRARAARRCRRPQTEREAQHRKQCWARWREVIQHAASRPPRRRPRSCAASWTGSSTRPRRTTSPRGARRSSPQGHRPVSALRGRSAGARRPQLGLHAHPQTTAAGDGARSSTWSWSTTPWSNHVRHEENAQRVGPPRRGPPSPARTSSSPTPAPSFGARRLARAARGGVRWRRRAERRR